MNLDYRTIQNTVSKAGENLKELIISIVPDEEVIGVVYVYGGEVIEELDHPFVAAITILLSVYNNYWKFGEAGKVKIILQDTGDRSCIRWQSFFKNEGIKFELVKGLRRRNPLGSSWEAKNSYYAKKLVEQRNGNAT